MAVEKLAGRNVGPSAIESACRSCAVDVKSREMDCESLWVAFILPMGQEDPWDAEAQADLHVVCLVDEFVTIVRHLEDSGEI